MSAALYRRLDAIAFWLAVCGASLIALNIALTLTLLNFGDRWVLQPSFRVFCVLIGMMTISGLLVLVSELNPERRR